MPKGTSPKPKQSSSTSAPALPAGIPTPASIAPSIPTSIPNIDPTEINKIAKGAMKEMVKAYISAGLGNSPIIIIAQVLVSLVIILVVGLIIYWIYLMIMHYYPRPFALGHTEPLEQFMEGYIPELVASIQKANIANIPSWLPPPGSTVTPENASYLYLYFALGDDYADKSVLQIADKLVDCAVSRALVQKVQADYHSFDPKTNDTVKRIEEAKAFIESARTIATTAAQQQNICIDSAQLNSQ